MISWTIYDHPSDYPNCYVARQFVNAQPTTNIMLSPDLESLRQPLRDLGLTCFARAPTDDSIIMETWL